MTYFLYELLCLPSGVILKFYSTLIIVFMRNKLTLSKYYALRFGANR